MSGNRTRSPWQHWVMSFHTVKWAISLWFRKHDLFETVGNVTCHMRYFRNFSLKADHVMLARRACVCWVDCTLLMLWQLYTLKIQVFWDLTLSLEEESSWRRIWRHCDLSKRRELFAERHGVISQKATPMCESQVSHLYKLFLGMTMYSDVVKAFARSLSEWARRFGWESSRVRPEYKKVQADVHRLRWRDCLWCAPWLRTQALPRRSLLSKYHTFLRYTRKCNFICTHKKVTALPCHCFYGIRKCSTALCTGVNWISPKWDNRSGTYARKYDSLNRLSRSSCLFDKFLRRTPVPNYLMLGHRCTDVVST
jgi:hypothetical protein